jgi:hypothetical protein
MNAYRSHVLSFSIGCFIVTGMPIHALSLGLNVVGTAPCGTATQNLVGHFSSSGAQYSATGQCTTPGSLGAPRTFPYTVKGAYANNTAEEVIEVAPAPISQPSHPSGKWQTKYSCPSDPWLTPDGPPFDPANLRLKCQIIARNDQSSEFGPRRYQDGKPLPSLSELFDAWRAYKPMTSVVLMPAERNTLAVKRDADLKAEAADKLRATQLLQGARQPAAPYSASLYPVIVSPVAGQRFLNQSPVPIKLAPPQPWADTQLRLDGTPVKTANSVTGYMVRLERKDSNGNWAPHTTIPVGAAQAESVTGYTGFGAGAPPAFLSGPGAWRMSAQVTAPQRSGWSNWVEFVVMAPVTNKALQAPTKGFGK